jgi:hypothetical protein
MSFGYNEIDFDEVESVSLTDGDISPTASEPSDHSDTLTSEQKRKRQLVELLDSEFNRFETFLGLLIESYDWPGEGAGIAQHLGVPDYAKCRNCQNCHEMDDEMICSQTRHQKDGKTFFNIIPDTDSIPSFCPSSYPPYQLPEEKLNDVDEWLIRAAEEGYDDYVEERTEYCKQRRQQHIENNNEQSDYVTKEIDELIDTKDEYTADTVTKLTKRLFEASSFDRYRRHAMKISWLRHLDDVLQEDYHYQRAEAYLRALNSTHQTETLPGQGGDQFEKEIREWLASAGWEMYDSVLELDGVSAKHKEMDIHTELPTADRAIFEVFTRGAHRDKGSQLADYAQLLQSVITESVEQILLSDYGLSKQRIDQTLFFELLDTDNGLKTDREVPGELRNLDTSRYEYLGDAESLHYSGYKPAYKPSQQSRQTEKMVFDKLCSHGFNPSYPVFKKGVSYGFCGPTIQIASAAGDLTVAFHSKRQRAHDADHNIKDHMSKKPESGGRYEWMMSGFAGWRYGLSSFEDNPVMIVEIDGLNQSRLHPAFLDAILRAD